MSESNGSDDAEYRTVPSVVGRFALIAIFGVGLWATLALHPAGEGSRFSMSQHPMWPAGLAVGSLAMAVLWISGALRWADAAMPEVVRSAAWIVVGFVTPTLLRQFLPDGNYFVGGYAAALCAAVIIMLGRPWLGDVRAMLAQSAAEDRGNAGTVGMEEGAAHYANARKRDSAGPQADSSGQPAEDVDFWERD